MRQHIRQLFLPPDATDFNRGALSYLSFVFSSLVVLIILVSWFSEFFDFRAQKTAPKAIAGVLDLRASQLEEFSVFPLAGEWQAKIGALVEPDDWQRSKTPTDILTLPGSWIDQTVNGKPVPKHGTVSYHLRIKLPTPREPLAIYVPTVGTSYRLYIDGKLMSHGGTVDINPSKSEAGYNANIVYFAPQHSEFSLLLQVANYEHKWGGMWQYLLFGESSSLVKYRAKSKFVSVILISILFTVIVFYMVIFAMNRREWVYPVVAVICGLLIVRELETSRILDQVFFPDLSFLTLTRINYATIYLGIAALYTCFRISFPHEFSRRYTYASYCICGFSTVFTLTTTANEFAELLFPFQIYTAMSLVYMLVNLIRAAINHRVGARTMLFGSIAFFIISTNDLLYNMGLVDTTPALPFGIAAFVFSHSFASYKRFVSTSYENRKLAIALADQNQELASFSQSLEKQVAKRTAQLEETNQRLERLALRDPLTRVRNRLGIEAVLDQAHATLQRNGSAYSLLIVDLDRFKRINDERGHDIGDTVLTQAAKAMAKSIRLQDIVARWGGEEFIILLPDTELTDALFRADSVRRVIETQVTEAVGFKVTCSIGIAQALASEDVEHVIQRADKALYKAKESGRNCVRVSKSVVMQGDNDE